VNVPYIPGSAPPPDLPLGRFLPPIPQGMVRAWCRENLNPGDWVLEPFGFNPLTVIEIASAGYPVLVCVNNPIHAFLLQVLASAPQAQDLVSALQDLAIASKGDDRMEPYIRSLYHVNCANCNRQVEADVFLWKKEADQPYAARVNCGFCGASGEQPLDAERLASLTPLPPKRLHMARALNRIAERDDALREQVENALNAYPTRPLIILQTIINKLESLEQSPRRRELLIALILSAADRGNTLWAYPSPRNRPRQITHPTVYQERNLWKVMEESVTAWQDLKAPIPLAPWQGVPDQSIGIFNFNGRIRELTNKPPDGFFSAVIAPIPRPNQAFWTLSALWTGWIWGQEAVAPIRQVLARQRYDWNWHCQALMGVFDAIHPLSHDSLKIWGLIAENEPMFLLASLLAADAKGFRLSAFAHAADDQLAQCSWETILDPHRPHPDEVLNTAREAARNYLNMKGEPANYQQVHTAIVTTLAHENKLVTNVFLQNISQAVSETQKHIEILFQEPHLFTRVTGEKASLETGEWWLADPKGATTTLFDHLEEHIYGHLVSTVTTTAEQVKRVAYRALPGIFTPEDALILNCLDSYAKLVDPPTHQWRLRDNEQPAARQADIQVILQTLNEIAQRLDYRVSGHEPLYWYAKDDSTPDYRFHVLTTAIVSPYVPQPYRIHPTSSDQDWADGLPARTNILVLPGSRANLLAFKQQRDQILKTRLDRDFLVVKFRLVRDLAANPLLSRELFRDLIHADPPEYRASQLALL
jgi:hypothetical protein